MMNRNEHGTLADIARKVVAAAVEAETGIVPAELIACQALLESGWLDSAPGNNPFGHKAPKTGGVLRQTTEVFTHEQAAQFLLGRAGRRLEAIEPVGADRLRTRYKAWDWFAVYDSLADAFREHVRILSKPRYAEAMRKWVDHRSIRVLGVEIALVGYATENSTQYGRTLADLLAMDVVAEAFEVIDRPRRLYPRGLPS